MVYQMPSATEQLLFVASTLGDENQAQTEIAQWAQEHGYLPPKDGQSFVIYHGGTEAREWRLIERRRLAPTSGSGTGH